MNGNSNLDLLNLRAAPRAYHNCTVAAIDIPNNQVEVTLPGGEGQRIWAEYNNTVPLSIGDVIKIWTAPDHPTAWISGETPNTPTQANTSSQAVAIGDALRNSGLGLTANYPCSNMSISGDLVDMSSNGHNLSINSVPVYKYVNNTPYIDLDGVDDYFSLVDSAELDILGNEAFIDSGSRGFTVMAWAYPSRLTNAEVIATKADGISHAQAMFQLFLRGDAGDVAQFTVANTAGDNAIVVNSSNNFLVSTWQFIVGRFVPSTSIDVFLSDGSTMIKSTNTTSVPASLKNSSAPLQIGARNGANVLYQGGISRVSMYKSALTDDYIDSIYQAERVLFEA